MACQRHGLGDMGVIKAGSCTLLAWGWMSVHVIPITHQTPSFKSHVSCVHNHTALKSHALAFSRANASSSTPVNFKISQPTASFQCPFTVTPFARVGFLDHRSGGHLLSLLRFCPPS